MPTTTLIVGAAILLDALIVTATLVWVRVANLEDLLVLLLYRRVGKTPPQISQYQGFF